MKSRRPRKRGGGRYEKVQGHNEKDVANFSSSEPSNGDHRDEESAAEGTNSKGRGSGVGDGSRGAKEGGIAWRP